MCTHINDRHSKAQGEPRREALGRNKGKDLRAVTGRKKGGLKTLKGEDGEFGTPVGGMLGERESSL